MIKKKKGVDYGALRSSFMQIPSIKVETARALLNLGYKDIFEVQGRDSNILFEECIKSMPETQNWILDDLKIIVNFPELKPSTISMRELY